MRQMLEYQADRIEAVLAHHKIPARVTGGTVTPRWIRFQVGPALGARIASITGLAEELAAALDAPTVRVARQGAAVAVEVPREDPHPVRLLPLLQGLHNVPPVTAVLGIADDGVPLLIRLPSPDVAHILVAGTTGSGKTALLRVMILSLAYFNRPQTTDHRPQTTGHGRQPPVARGPLSGGSDPSSVVFVLVDPKGSAFGDLEGLPHLARPVISDPAEAVEALGSLVRWMEAVSRQGSAVSRKGSAVSREGVEPPLTTNDSRLTTNDSRLTTNDSRLTTNDSRLTTIILVIDELADLLMVAGAEAERPLTRLLQRGREAGVHVVAATQKPTAAVIGSLVKANFPVRLVGKVTSPEDARVATGWKGTGAERLLGRGDFIAVAEGQLHRFQAAYVAPEEVRQVVAEIRNQRIRESANGRAGEHAGQRVRMPVDWQTHPLPPR